MTHPPPPCRAVVAVDSRRRRLRWWGLAALNGSVAEARFLMVTDFHRVGGSRAGAGDLRDWLAPRGIGELYILLCGLAFGIALAASQDSHSLCNQVGFVHGKDYNKITVVMG